MASNPMTLGICVCTIFFFLGSTEPLAFGHIAKYYPEHITGTIGGLMMGTYVFIGMASVTVCSKAMEISGYHMSFIILVGVAIIGAFAALFLKPVKQG
jgi:MFS family permease